MKLSRLLLAALLYALAAVMPTIATAQCSGIFTAGYFCGNSAAGGGLAGAASPTAMFDRAFGGTNNSTVVRLGGVWTVLSSANSGVWITSAAGVPSISSTLPNAVQDNITRVGTIISGVWSGTPINWTPTGTGGAARTITSSLQERGVTPTDYGAIINDNTKGTINAAAFVNAFNASPKVYCKPGDIFYVESIVVPATAANLRDCILVAAGSYSASTAVVSVTSNSTIPGFIAENLNISINTAVYTTTNGISFINSPNGVIKNSFLSGAYPVYIAGTSNNVRVEDNTFPSSGIFSRAIHATSDNNAATTATLSIASPMVVTKATAHGLVAGAPIIFYSTGALPTGLTAGRTYYVLAAGSTPTTFQVSATAGGAAINSSGTQSGTQYYTSNGATGLIISGNNIYKSATPQSQGIILIGASNAIVTNNSIFGSAHFGIASMLGANNAIVNNVAWYGVRELFHTDSGVNISIKGNQAIYDGTSLDVGISVSNDNGPPAIATNVVGNTIDFPNATGIYIVGSQYGSVSGNIIKNSSWGTSSLSPLPASITLDGSLTQNNTIGQNTIYDTAAKNQYHVAEANYGNGIPSNNFVSQQIGTAGTLGYNLTVATTETIARASNSTSSSDTKNGFWFGGSAFAKRDLGATAVELFDYDSLIVGSLGGNASQLMNWGQTAHRWSSRNYGAIFASLSATGWNWTNIAAPGTPAAGTTNVYADSTRKVLCGKDDAAVVTCIPPGIETAWTSYTPTVTASSGTFTTVSATGAYKQVGKTIFVRINVTITTNGTAAGRVEATLPVTANVASGSQALSGFNDTTAAVLSAAIVSAASTKILLFTAAGAYPGANATVLVAQGAYEVP